MHRKYRFIPHNAIGWLCEVLQKCDVVLWLRWREPAKVNLPLLGLYHNALRLSHKRGRVGGMWIVNEVLRVLCWGGWISLVFATKVIRLWGTYYNKIIYSNIIRIIYYGIIYLNIKILILNYIQILFINKSSKNYIL